MGFIIAENFDRLGSVDSDGFIYDSMLNRVGRIHKDGKIYNERFECCGRVDSDGYIYLSNLKRVGRIYKDGSVYDECFNRVGRLDADIVAYIFQTEISESGKTYGHGGKYQRRDKNLNNGRNNFSNENVTGGSSVDGAVVPLIIIGLFAAYCVFSVGPGILNGMINSFMALIFLAVALLGGVAGMLFQENQFSTIFFVDYIFLMIFWFMILSQENFYGGLEEIVIAILCVIIGFVLMAIIGIIVAGISYLFKALLEYLFRWKICKIVIIILLLIFASIITWWFATQEGFYQILEMIDEWNNQSFF